MEITGMFDKTTGATGSPHVGHMGGDSPFLFGGMMILGWLTWILVIVALVLAIVWFWKQIRKK